MYNYTKYRPHVVACGRAKNKMAVSPWLSPETPPYETDFSPLRQPLPRTPRTRPHKPRSNLAVSSCFPPSLDVLIIAPFARAVKSFYKKNLGKFRSVRNRPKSLKKSCKPAVPKIRPRCGRARSPFKRCFATKFM